MSNEEKTTQIIKKSTVRIRQDTKGKMGIVRCNNFRCLGVMGEDGIWRDAHHRSLEVIEVVTEF